MLVITVLVNADCVNATTSWVLDFEQRTNLSENFFKTETKLNIYFH